jgi:hypothetical protein
MTKSNEQGASFFTVCLAIIALSSLVVTLFSTILAIWQESSQKADFLELTKILLDWKIIAGGLLIGGGKEIKNLIRRIKNQNSVNPSGVKS